VDNVYHVIAVAGAVAVTGGALLTIIRLQAERPFSSLRALLTGAGTAGSLAVYVLVLDITLKQAAVGGLVAGGAVLGALAGTKVPLYRRDGAVFSRAAGWHLAPPGLAIAAFQVEGLRGSPDGVILSMAAVYAATAFAVAASVLLLIRRVAQIAPAAVVERNASVAAPSSTTAGCPSCGVPLRAGARFCVACGVALPGETAAEAPPKPMEP
jgi:hypothetical protein